MCRVGGLKGSYDIVIDDRRYFWAEIRFRVLRLLEQNSKLLQRELADVTGIITGSAHYVLKALVDKGRVKLGNFTASEDKRRYAYVLIPKGIATRAAMTQFFLRGSCESAKR